MAVEMAVAETSVMVVAQLQVVMIVVEVKATVVATQLQLVMIVEVVVDKKGDVPGIQPLKQDFIISIF